MSVETSKKLQTYKGIKKVSFDIEKIFLDLKFNKKHPKYNYHSGLVAGMMINDFSILQPIVEGKVMDKEIGIKMLERVVPKAKSLVEDFNWKLDDLTNLMQQFFGDQSD